MNEVSVNLNKVINASQESLFDAWLDPKVMASFMMPMEGMKEPLVKVDASIGGEFSIIMELEGNKLPHGGKFIEIDRPKKLVFTWESAFSPKDSVVTLEFTKLDDKKTNIELTHTKFTDEQNRQNHIGGWNGMLNALSNLYT